jgi:polysaccharide export outer membrane protein
MKPYFQRTLFVLSCLTLSACSVVPRFIPTSGPGRSEVQQGVQNSSIAANGAPGAIQLVDVTDQIVQQLRSQQQQQLFSQTLGNRTAPALLVGVGDSLEVSIWEAPPAALFGSTAMDTRSGGSISTARNATIPETVVNAQGEIAIPFAGNVKVAERSLHQIETDIAQRLKGKANHPQVQVRLTRNMATSVTVVGEVLNSIRMPLTPKGERLLDALASAGGVRHPVNKVSLQVTRGQAVHSLPLDTIIRDPQQNIPLLPGDVVTALHQPLSFTALGALTKNEEVDFEGQGITLSQALARVGGLQDQRSDAQGVFVFRLEDAKALSWPKPAVANADGQVPVIYRINLRDPRSFFVAQGFAVHNKDILYVSNAPAADLQKFVNVIAGIGYPIANLISVTK